MKLYIPTSTLNIDNILSTESIAPYSFYTSRTYGYTHFTRIDCIPYINSLVLFSKIPNFELHDCECETHPMILEIEFEDKNESIIKICTQNEVDVYVTHDVLRLNPYTCRVLFFDPSIMNLARLTCSDSLTNKLGNRFNFNLCNGEFRLETINFDSIKFKDSCPNYEEKVIQDNKLDKIKGFIFGYYLGVSKSVSPNTAKLLKIRNRVYDIIASIKSNGGLGTKSFYDELTSLDEEYRKLDPSRKKYRSEWVNYLAQKGIPVDRLEDLLKELDPNNVLKINFMNLKGYVPLSSIRSFGLTNIQNYIEALGSHTIKILKSERTEYLNRFKSRYSFIVNPYFESCSLANESRESTLYNRFLNSICWNENSPTTETLRTDRFNISTEITKLTKSIWESDNIKWENSSARNYMNALRSNIKSFTNFNVTDEPDIILRSIALYILKGEDYDSLLQLCEDSSLDNCSYVFGLWGATIGYVKIPKSIVNDLLTTKNFDENLKGIYELLYNVHLEGTLPNVQEIVSIKSKTPIATHNSEMVIKEISITDWQNEIKNYLLGMKRVPKKQMLLKSLDVAFQQYGNDMDPVKFFAFLNDYDEWKTSRGEPTQVWENLKNHFCGEDYPKTFGNKMAQKRNKKHTEPDLFDKENTKIRQNINDSNPYEEEQQTQQVKPYKQPSFIYTDADVLFTSLNKIPHNLIKDLIFNLHTFQNKYKEGGYYYNNPEKYQRTNYAVINHFVSYCFSEKNKDIMKIDYRYSREVEKIKQFLLEYFKD